MHWGIGENILHAIFPKIPINDDKDELKLPYNNTLMKIDKDD